MLDRPSLPECMMRTAEIFSSRSTCSRLSVGCVITNSEMTTIDAIGYNGGARGLSNFCESQEPGKCGHLHAEINALVKSNYHLQGKRAFVTAFPCRMCAKAIVNGGITAVFYREAYRDMSSMEIFLKAGVKVYHIMTGGSIKQCTYYRPESEVNPTVEMSWSDLGHGPV
jgi:dCMP deaminase